MATGLHETTHSDALEASYAAWEQIYRDMLASRLPPVYGEYEPVRIGPTWEWGDGWVLPEFSLGWGVLAWCSHWLRDKDNGPWVFTPEQARFVLWFFAIDGEGRFVNDSAVLQRLKGWGKDPLAATLTLAFLCGPVKFSHFDSDGRPVAVDDPTAWIQVVAVSQEQTKNTLKVFPWIITERFKAEYRVVLQKTSLYALGERQIQAVTASPLALEGGRPTLVVCNEALDLKTPLPTPSGWTTVGDVAVGDSLIGSNGSVNVVKVTEVYEGRPCYRVTFADGQSIVADEGHLWDSKPVSSDAKARIRTTREMFEDGRRFNVPLITSPFDGPDAPLPIDPYTLGYWLGDGDSTCPTLAVGDEDKEWLIGEMERRGYIVKVTKGKSSSADRVGLRIPNCRRNRNDPRPLGLYGRLREAGLIGNKHVPVEYLRGSAEQRLELLRGLMDSDGCLSGRRALFVNTNRNLADAVAEIARGFGYAVHVSAREAGYKPNAAKLYRVEFSVDERFNPFRMPRKANRVTGRRLPRKSIISIEPVDSVPVKCIEVDSEDHLFAAGEGWTLTHNTQNWNASNGGTEMYGVLEGNSAKSEGGQARMLFICNAYRPGEESVGERIRLAWEDTQGDDAEFESFGLMYDSLEAPPHAPLELDAVEDVIKAVRGDAVWLDPERIANSIKNQTNTVSESRRKWYNQILAVADAWVDPADWRMCGRKRDLVPGEKIVLFFDGSKSGDHTGLVGCCIEDGYVFLGGVWEPEKIGKDLWRVDREAVDIRVSELVDEFRVLGIWGDPSDARDDETGERYWEPYFDMWHKRWGRKFRLWAQRSGNYMHSVNWDMRSPERLKRFIEAAELFTTDVASHQLPHDMSPLLARHVGNARRRPDPRFGIGLSKATKDSDKKIDLAVCAVGARMMRREALMDPRIRTGGSQGKSRTHIMR